MTPEQIAHFRTEGWLCQSGVLREQVPELLEELHRVSSWTGAPGRSVVMGGPWLETERAQGRWYTPVRNLVDQSEPWLRACRDVLGHTAAQLLGDNVRLENVTGVLKPPEVGQTFPWHQDGVYYGPSDGRYILANVYLDDVTPENGSLQVIARSHTQLWAHHTDAGKKAVRLPPDPEVIAPQAQAGDVLWFYLWTVHGSGPNLSPHPRRAVRAGYLGLSGRVL